METRFSRGCNIVFKRSVTLSSRVQCERPFLRRRTQILASSGARVTCNIRTLPSWNRRRRELDELLKQPDYNNEMGRPSRRTIFNVEDWKIHRSETRFIRHLSSTFNSEVLRDLWKPAALCGASATFLCTYELARSTWPETFGFLPSLCIGQLPFELTSAALGLLLVFRTDSSYSRWLDARGYLSGISSGTADACRAAVVWFNYEDERLVQGFVRWDKAFFKTVQHHLRGCESDADLERDLSEYLLPEEVGYTLIAHNRPSFVLQQLASIANNAQLNSDQHVALHEKLANLGEIVVQCERILTTPIPLSYTRFTNRFLMVWLLTLPMCLYRTCGLLSVPTEIAVALVLLGIEEVGVQIEEPFGILPIETLSELTVANLTYMEENREKVLGLLPKTRQFPNEKSGQVPVKGRNPSEAAAVYEI
mmetsp:Transcript_42215/g.70464  ORF Transcript_42215/g.70464 Transcript_42215/m.70464 type:complete len:422 (+) Transcript_42215:311-1576(+)